MMSDESHRTPVAEEQLPCPRHLSHAANMTDSLLPFGAGGKLMKNVKIYSFHTIEVAFVKHLNRLLKTSHSVEPDITRSNGTYPS